MTNLPTSWKIAKLTVDNGDFASGVVSSTAGRLSTLLSLQPLITKDFTSLQNPDIKDVQQLAKKLDKFKDQSIDDVKIYVNGTRPFDMMKRVWKNPRNGILGKLIGTISVPKSYISTALTRGDSYNPYSNTVHLFSKNPSTLLHELGHAEDFNSNDVPDTLLKREWNGLKRTAYGAGAYPIQPITSVIEFRAWQNARKRIKAIIKRFPKEKKLHEKLIDSYFRSMPGFFGSYVGNAIMPGLGSYAGSLGGSMIPTKHFREQLLKEIEEEKKTNKKKPAKQKEDKDGIR
jgi:hypothetical protein